MELCRRRDPSVGQIAKGFDPAETAAWDCVKQAEVGVGEWNGLPAENARSWPH